jgi:hypothetical protein
MFEQGGGGRRGCLRFQLWIKGVYHVDNFWPVDKLWIVKSAQSYPQVINSGAKTTPKSYPQLINRVMHIEYCVALEQQKPG